MSSEAMEVVADEVKPDKGVYPETITPKDLATEKPADAKNGQVATNGHHNHDDDNINEELTPPPDSPALETPVNDTMSNTSTPQLAVTDTEQDEIVVGTKAVHKHENSPPVKAQSEPENIDREDTEVEPEPENESEIEPRRVTVSINKRKRMSADDDMEVDAMQDVKEASKSASPIRQGRVVRPPGAIQPKGIILGFWRDSQPQDPAEKHAVIGFIDIRDRLRTRIQTVTRDGRSISSEFPVPPGPGGSWVTFDRIAFDDHLVNLDHFQVKEFVKVRMETISAGETLEEKARLDKEAVKEAIQFLQANPPTENTPANLAIAYGPQIPEHARGINRQEKKRRTGSLGPQLTGPPSATLPASLPQAVAGVAQSHAVPVDNLPGTRPTRILLGFWKLSSEHDEVDKHAVYGILGANDMFRVKLMKETRDGRPLMGNFPTGPGALWIHWDEVEFEPSLAALTRPEVKEYCRVRQRHIDEGERPEHRQANERQAIYDARKRVEAGGPIVVPRKDEPNVAPVPILKARVSPAVNGNGYDDSYDGPGPMGPPSIQPKHDFRRTRPRHSLPDVELRAANRPQSIDAMERTNNLARREVTRLENSQARRDQHEANREAYRNAHTSSNGTEDSDDQQQSLFKDNMHRLNKVWAAQEQNRQKAGVEDAKVFNGVKYERKQTGPFQGKLVSQGKIISIDGEDYVEYRVLTKPSFF